MDEFMREMRASFPDMDFDIRHTLALVDYKRFFTGWLNYWKIGTPTKRSLIAQSQGGRDEEAHHIKFYLDDMTSEVVVKYKYAEMESYPYIPRGHPIVVSVHFNLPLK